MKDIKTNGEIHVGWIALFVGPLFLRASMSGWVGHASLTCLRGHVSDVAQATGTKRFLGTPVVPFLSFILGVFLSKRNMRKMVFCLRGYW